MIMAKVAVQSKRSVSRGIKLVYQSKGPFVVVENTGFSLYMVLRYGKPDSALRKFMTGNLYMLPLTILSCEHLSTPDIRYLNSKFAPIKHPFDNTTDIESYNISWIEDQPPSRALITFI